MALSKERRQITPGEIRMTHFREELREKFGMRTVKSRMGEKIKPVTDSITNAEEKTPVLSVETTSTESASTPTSAEPKKRKSRSATLKTDIGKEAAPVAASEPKPMAQPEPILTSEPQPADFDVVVDGKRLGRVDDGRMFIDRSEQRTDDNVERTIHSGVYFEHVEGNVVNPPPTEPIVINHDHNPNYNNPWIVTGLGALVLAGVLGLAGMANSRRDIDAPIVPATTPSGAAGTSRPEATPTPEKIYVTPEPTVSPNPSLVVEIPSPTPVASATAEANSETQVSATPSEEVTLFITPASKDANGNWVINTPDAEASTIKGIEGFTPDSNLVLAPEWGQVLKLDSAKFADFQKSLNNPKQPLVGYTYGENDQSDNLNYRRTLQAPLNSWTVLTGEEVEVPGIGHLKANPGGAVEVMIMNITDSVIDFGPKNPVMIKHGFTGTGRIWDGKNVVEDERGIASHYVSRLENGVTLPGESGFIGQCDKPGNCEDIKVVSAIYTQWGNNQDGTPRYQFQLLRQEQVNN